MQKLVALLFLVSAALALPNPNSDVYCPRRCLRYKFPSQWNPQDCWNDVEYILVASTGLGAYIGWDSDYDNCNGFFTYGLECCGSCTYAYFSRNSRYSNKYDAYTLGLYSWNSCFDRYDISENLFATAYDGGSPIYRSFFQDQFSSDYMRFREIVDPNFLPWDLPDQKFYSVSVLGYCQKSHILILVACNSFDYLSWGAPAVFVLAQKPRLTRAEKRWVREILDDNGIDLRTVFFRENHNCKPRDPFKPILYL